MLANRVILCSTARLDARLPQRVTLRPSRSDWPSVYFRIAPKADANSIFECIPVYSREVPTADVSRCSKFGAYSITSSAMASTPGGMARPRAFAVLRLMTSSNLLDWKTGKSAGLAPFRICPV
jgi:hypothetical protein